MTSSPATTGTTSPYASVPRSSYSTPTIQSVPTSRYTTPSSFQLNEMKRYFRQMEKREHKREIRRRNEALLRQLGILP